MGPPSPAFFIVRALHPFREFCAFGVPLGARKGPVNGFEAYVRVNFYDRGRTGGAAPLPKTGWSAQVVNERRLSVVYV